MRVRWLTGALAVVAATVGQTLEDAQRLYDEGKAAYDGGNLEAAEARWREVLAIRERLAPDSLELASTLFALGNVAEDRFDLATAEQCYGRSLAIRQRQAPESLEVADCLGRLGLVAWYAHDLERAQERLERCLSIRRRLAPDSLLVAAALNGLGLVAWSRGDLAAAQASFEADLSLQERLDPESAGCASALNSLGAVVASRGETDRAYVLFSRALTMQQRLRPGSRIVAATHTNLGILAHDRGDLEAARAHHLEAMAVLERIAPDSPDLASTLANLATACTDLGDHAASQAYHERSLAIRERLAPDSADVAAALLNLGAVAQEGGDLGRSETYTRRALALFQRLQPDSLAVAACLNNLGTLLNQRGLPREAEALHRQALALRQALAPGSLGEAESWSGLGSAASQDGRLEEAASHYAAGLAIYQRLSPESLSVAAALGNLSRVAAERGDAAHAVDYANRAVQLLERNRRRVLGGESRALLVRRYGTCYSSLLAACIQVGGQAPALAALEGSRARSLLDSLLERHLDFAADAPPELLARQTALDDQLAAAHRELGRLSPQTAGARIDELGETIRSLGVEQRALEAELRAASPSYAALQYPEPLDAAGIQAALDPATLLLAFSLGEETAYLFAVTRERIEVHELGGHGDELAGKCASFSQAAGTPRGATEAAGRELYDLLLRPAQDAIDRAQRLLISPDGPLHRLPFAALVTSPAGEPVRYLVEEKPLHQVVSMTVYQQLRQAAQRGTGQVVALGDPAPPAVVGAPPAEMLTAQARSLGGLGALPFAAREAREIGGLFGDRATVLVGAEASEAAAKTQLGEAEIIHFACHGVSLDDHPLDSSLVLADGGGEDGLLQAWEIFEDVRLKADLVVLSACESGAGQVQRHEGLIGLTRAFQYAGARSIIASLWRVADETSLELMTALYRQRAAGATKDEALRAAQLALIRSDRAIAGTPVSHPYFWATYVLTGDWR